MMMGMIVTSTLIVAGIVGLLVFGLVIWIVTLEQRLKKLAGGKNGASLEDTITANQRAIAELAKFRKTIEGELGRLDGRMKKKIHGAKTLRFNPFHGSGTGGNQSFATALLDEDGNGVVLSTLYSREKVSVFAKPIVYRKSEFELTDEEREVLKN